MCPLGGWGQETTAKRPSTFLIHSRGPGLAASLQSLFAIPLTTETSAQNTVASEDFNAKNGSVEDLWVCIATKIVRNLLESGLSKSQQIPSNYLPVPTRLTDLQNLKQVSISDTGLQTWPR